MLPDNVNVSLESRGAKWVLRAVIYLSESKFRSGSVMTPSIVEAAEEALKRALNIDAKLVVEYDLVP